MIDPGLTAVPVDIPVEWAMNGCDAPAMRGGVDRFYRWHDGAWMRRVTHAFPVGGERPVEYVVTVDRTRHVFRGRVLAFHPDGLALVMEEPVRTLVVIPVDALRVREKEREQLLRGIARASMLQASGRETSRTRSYMHRLSQIGTVVVRRGGQPARSTPKNALLVDPLLAAGKTRVSLQAEDTTTWIDIPNALIPGLVERLVKASSEEGV